MNRNEPPGHRSIHDPKRAEAERARDERIRDPYEAHRSVRTFGADNAYAAAHPWDAAHGDAAHDPASSDVADASTWSDQPARYGGGYRGDERNSAADRATGHRGPRHAADDGRLDHYARGQSNSGYDDSEAEDRHLRRRADHPRDATPAGQTGPRDRSRGGTPGRGSIGAQAGHQDTYGSAGYEQQGKRYQFDEAGDERGRAASFRGVRPRNFVRSDERLRELINEHLTDADIDANDIEVKVSGGTVTLEGTVSHRSMKHQAEDIVDECGGVNDIHNHLRVRHRAGQPQHSPDQPPATTAVKAPSTTNHADKAAGQDAGGVEGNLKESAERGAEPAGAAMPGETNRKH